MGIPQNILNLYNAGKHKEFKQSEYQNFLRKIGYLVENKGDFSISPKNIDNEIIFSIINKSQYPDSNSLDIILKEKLQQTNIDLICLAGYMKMIPDNIVAHFENCILNIHPALLPDFGGKGFYGMKVHEAVIKSNAVESGATVHFVDNQYDHGPIIAQKKVPILDTDNAEILAEKVLKAEHDLYPGVVKAFCENRINWERGLPKIVKERKG